MWFDSGVFQLFCAIFLAVVATLISTSFALADADSEAFYGGAGRSQGLKITKRSPHYGLHDDGGNGYGYVLWPNSYGSSPFFYWPYYVWPVLLVTKATDQPWENKWTHLVELFVAFKRTEEVKDMHVQRGSMSDNIRIFTWLLIHEHRKSQGG